MYMYVSTYVLNLLTVQVLIIEGETGSGKTTQIPQYLFEDVCTWYIYVLVSKLNRNDGVECF